MFTDGYFADFVLMKCYKIVSHTFSLVLISVLVFNFSFS